ncbi:MAG: hypothetical protein ACRC92_08030 [Peptostreptococcaceae bacterium]
MIKFIFRETTTIVVGRMKFHVHIELLVGSTCNLTVSIDDSSLYIFSERFANVGVNTAFGAMGNELHNVDEWHHSESNKDVYISLIKIIDDYLDLLKLFALEVL